MRRSAPALLVALALACGTSSPARRPDGAGPAATPPPAAAQPKPEILVARARVLRAEGDVSGARARLEAALAAAPADEDARIELADLLVADGGDLERAGALLAGVASRSAPRLHLVRARLAEARGDDEWAQAEYALALAEGEDPDARLRRALALERLGRFDEAIADLESARAARPDDVVARGRLAERYEAAGRTAEAEAELRFLAEADPDRPASWEQLARFYARIGRTKDAKDARAAASRARAAGGRTERSLRPLPPSAR